MSVLHGYDKLPDGVIISVNDWTKFRCVVNVSIVCPGDITSNQLAEKLIEIGRSMLPSGYTGSEPQLSENHEEQNENI